MVRIAPGRKPPSAGAAGERDQDRADNREDAWSQQILLHCSRHDFYDPFSGFSMFWNPATRQLYSVGKDGKDDSGDVSLGVAVQSTTTNLHQDRNARRILGGMGCGILSADSTDQSGLGMECTLDIFHKSIRIAEKSDKVP